MTKAMNIVYEIGDKLYINLTNRCSCRCVFCLREEGDGAHGSDTLWLEHEPSATEVVAAIDELNMDSYAEAVFCGFGEPTEAFDVLKEVARHIKGSYSLPVRVDTNGQGSLINGRDITPELAGIVDKLSISLNSSDPGTYLALTRSEYGEQAFPAMLDFTRRAKAFVPHITMTTVATTITPQDEAACADLCASLGVGYRIRAWA